MRRLACIAQLRHERVHTRRGYLLATELTESGTQLAGVAEHNIDLCFPQTDDLEELAADTNPEAILGEPDRKHGKPSG